MINNFIAPSPVHLPYENSALRSCALVSHGFLGPSRQHIFRDIALIREVRCSHLCVIFASSPHLGRNVRRLEIRGNFVSGSTTPPAVLRNCGSVDCLTLSKFPVKYITPHLSGSLRVRTFRVYSCQAESPHSITDLLSFLDVMMQTIQLDSTSIIIEIFDRRPAQTSQIGRALASLNKLVMLPCPRSRSRVGLF